MTKKTTKTKDIIDQEVLDKTKDEIIALEKKRDDLASKLEEESQELESIKLAKNDMEVEVENMIKDAGEKVAGFESINQPKGWKGYAKRSAIQVIASVSALSLAAFLQDKQKDAESTLGRVALGGGKVACQIVGLLYALEIPQDMSNTYRAFRARNEENKVA